MNQITSPTLVHIDWLLSYYARMPEWRPEEYKRLMSNGVGTKNIRQLMFTGWWIFNIALLTFIFSWHFYLTKIFYLESNYFVCSLYILLGLSYIGRCFTWNFISVQEIGRFRTWKDHHVLWWSCNRLPYTGHPDGPLYRTLRFFEADY